MKSTFKLLAVPLILLLGCNAPDQPGTSVTSKTSPADPPQLTPEVPGKTNFTPPFIANCYYNDFFPEPVFDDVPENLVEEKRMELTEEDPLVCHFYSYPHFPGGEDARLAYMKEHISFPESADPCQIPGTVFVRFTIQTDGRVTDVTLLRGICDEADNIVLKATREMPNWVFDDDGLPREATCYHMPVRFRLEDVQAASDKKGSEKQKQDPADDTLKRNRWRCDPVQMLMISEAPDLHPVSTAHTPEEASSPASSNKATSNTPSLARQTHCQVYPNPAADEFSVTGLSAEGQHLLWLFDLSGQFIFSTEVNNDVPVDIRRLASGTFVLKIVTDGQPCCESRLIVSK